MRLVGFTTQHQAKLHDLHKTKSPVKITNCEVKNSRHGQGYDIILKTDSQITKSPKKLDETKVVNLDTLPSIPQYERVSVKVLEVFQPEEVGIDKKKKQDICVADHTAATKVVLWGDNIGSLQEGCSYDLANFHV